MFSQNSHCSFFLLSLPLHSEPELYKINIKPAQKWTRSVILKFYKNKKNRIWHSNGCRHWDSVIQDWTCLPHTLSPALLIRSPASMASYVRSCPVERLLWSRTCWLNNNQPGTGYCQQAVREVRADLSPSCAWRWLQPHPEPWLQPLETGSWIQMVFWHWDIDSLCQP